MNNLFAENFDIEVPFEITNTSYNEHAKTIIISILKKINDKNIESLFIRTIEEDVYKVLANDNDFSYRGFINDADQPVVIVSTWKPDVENGRQYSFWENLIAFDLSKNASRVILDEKLILQNMECNRAWVSKLIKSCNGGRTLYVILAEEVSVNTSEKKVNYWLSCLEFNKEIVINKLAALKNIFY